MKPVPHNLVRTIRFWTIKSPEQDFKYCTARSVEDETRNDQRCALVSGNSFGSAYGDHRVPLIPVPFPFWMMIAFYYLKQ